MLIFITIRGVKGTRLRLELAKAMTVGQLVAKLEKVHGYAAAVGSLIYSGELLEEEKTLAESGIENEGIVWFIVGKKHLALRQCVTDSDPTYQRSINVVLRDDGKGTIWFFRLSPASTVGHLKKLVKGASRVPEDAQTLVFMGHVLKDANSTLSQINYIQNYVIQLWVDNQKLKPIFHHKQSHSVDFSPATNALVRKQLFGGKRQSLVEPLVSSNNDDEISPVSKYGHPLAGTEMANQRPELLSDGLGGTYLILDADHEPLAVFKPHDEEPQAPRNPRGLCGRMGGPALKRGVRAGEGSLREYIAYLLDRDHFAGVPHTGLVYINWDQLGRPVTEATPLVQPMESFNDGNRLVGKYGANWKMGSVQAWQPNIGYAEDFGFANFGEENVQAIAMLDIRLANLDRHSGNLLAVRSHDNVGKQFIQLVPIDHGYCLPEYTDLEDVSFEWLTWPQVKTSICREVRNRIANMNVEDDCKMLRKLGLRNECVVTHFMTSTLLKKASARGFSLREIGEMMQRQSLSRQSFLEQMRDRAMKRAKMVCKGKKQNDISRMEEVMCAVFDDIVNIHLADMDKSRRPRSLSVVVENESTHLHMNFEDGTTSPARRVDEARRSEPLITVGTSPALLTGNTAESTMASPQSPKSSPTVHSHWSSDTSGLGRKLWQSAGGHEITPKLKVLDASLLNQKWYKFDTFKLDDDDKPSPPMMRSPEARRSISWGGEPPTEVGILVNRSTAWHPCNVPKPCSLAPM